MDSMYPILFGHFDGCKHRYPHRPTVEVYIAMIQQPAKVIAYNQFVIDLHSLGVPWQMVSQKLVDYTWM